MLRITNLKDELVMEVRNLEVTGHQVASAEIIKKNKSEPARNWSNPEYYCFIYSGSEQKNSVRNEWDWTPVLFAKKENKTCSFN